MQTLQAFLKIYIIYYLHYLFTSQERNRRKPAVTRLEKKIFLEHHTGIIMDCGRTVKVILKMLFQEKFFRKFKLAGECITLSTLKFMQFMMNMFGTHRKAEVPNLWMIPVYKGRTGYLNQPGSGSFLKKK